MGAPASPQRRRVVLDIVSDPLCPWCFVGFRSFLAARKRLDPTLQLLPRIRAYLLNPTMPKEGRDRRAYYEEKFPDREQRDAMALQLKAAAAGAGFTFDPAAPTHLPSAIPAQQLIRLAHFDGVQERLTDKVFTAYWRDLRDIGDEAVLVEIGAEAGLDPAIIRADFASPESRNTVLAEADAFRQTGVTGVPTYIVNERHGFSGALPPGRLAAAIDDASALA